MDVKDVTNLALALYFQDADCWHCLTFLLTKHLSLKISLVKNLFSLILFIIRGSEINQLQVK